MSSGEPDVNIIPEGIDTLSVIFILMVVISAIFQIIYMLSPQAIRTMLEKYDFVKPKEGQSTFLLYRF